MNCLTKKGQALIQTLVAIAILGIIVAVFASMTENQNREMAAVAQKLSVADFQQQLTRSFGDASLCTALLTKNPITFPTPQNGGPDNLDLKFSSIPIFVGSSIALVTADTPISPISNLKAAKSNTFALQNIQGSSLSGVGHYTSDFTVNLDSSNSIRSLRPPSTKVTLLTASSGGVETITSCQTSSSSSTTLIYSTYSMWGGKNPISPCTNPPQCNAGDVDKGVGYETTHNLTGGWSGYQGGNCVRTCATLAPLQSVMYIQVCGWSSSGPGASCTPPACGATDKQVITTCRSDGALTGGPSGTQWGSCRRYCLIKGT